MGWPGLSVVAFSLMRDPLNFSTKCLLFRNCGDFQRDFVRKCGGILMHCYFLNSKNCLSIMCPCVVTLPVAEHHGQATAGRLISATLEVVEIFFEREVCPSLAIQKRNKEYQSYSSETALGFNVL